MKAKFTFLIVSLFTLFQIASAATAVFNVTVPEGTNACYIMGNFTGSSWPIASAVKCTKVDATHYTVTLDEANFLDGVTLATLKYKYLSGGPDWAYVEKDAAGGEISDRTFTASPTADVVVKWASVWKDVAPVPGYFTIDIYTPKTVTECYMTGNFNGWLTPGTSAKVDSTDTKMNLIAANSDANGNYFSIKIYTANAYALAFQFTTGKAWIYQQDQGNNSYPDVSQPTALFDAVGDATANPPVAPAITFKRIFKAQSTTFNVSVPAGTNNAYIKGDLNGGASTDFIAGTKNTDGTFTFAIPAVDILYYKYYNDMLDANVEYKADGTAVTENRTADAQIATVFTDVVAAWVSTGIDNVKSASNLMYVIGNRINVEGVNSTVEVYSLDGRTIDSATLTGKFVSKILKKGIYIVRVDGETKKVAVD